MKSSCHVWLCLVATLFSSLSLLGQSGSPDLPKTVTAALDRPVSGSERAIIAMARAMPANRYSFAPTSGQFAGVRNFAQLLKHVAVGNYLNGAALLGQAPPVEVGSHENGPESVTDKGAVLKFVQDSFAYLH
jgi:hypothetical protein